MVDIKKTIEIIFAGTDSVSGTLKTIGGNIDAFGADISDIGQPFADAAGYVAVLDAAVAGLAIAGLTASSDIETASLKMQASLGLPVKEAEKFAEIAKDVYTTGFADDLAAAFEAVTLAQKKFGDNASVDIGKVTEQAFGLQKVFGTDYQALLGAVNTLMKNFGITSDEAFGFLAKGFQSGIDGSGDFLESITEYSVQFAGGGANAGQFFSILESGFQEGVAGTDKAADAFGEFRKRILDDSKITKDALALIGLDNTTLTKNINSGKTTIIDAFNLVIGKLNETTEESVKMQAGVGLIGTQFEDLGTKAALALTTSSTVVSDFREGLESIKIDDFAKQMESAWRTVTLSFGDLELWDNAKRKIAGIFTDIAENIPEAFEDVDFSNLVDAADEVWAQISAIFTETEFDLTTIEGLKNAIQTAIDSIQSIITVTGGMVEAFAPVAKAIANIIKWFNDLDDGSKALIGNALAIGTAFVTLGGIVSVGGALITGLGSLLTIISGPVGIVVGLAALVGVADAAIKSFLGITKAGEEASAKAEYLKKVLADIEIPPEIRTKIYAELDEGNFKKANKLLEDIPDEVSTDISADLPSNEVSKYTISLGEIPEDVSTRIVAAIEKGDFEEVQNIISGLGDDPVDIEISADVSGLMQTFETLEFWTESGGWQTITVPIELEVDKAKADIAVEELAAKTDPLKTLEIVTKLNVKEIDRDIAQLKFDAKTMQKAVEWTAKLDIAQVEAVTKQIESAFDSISEGFKTTADLISDSLGALTKGDDYSATATQARWRAQEVLEQEMRLRKQEAQLQKALIEQQTKQLELRNKQLEKTGGEMEIKIDSTGLEPSLEMVMWEIIQKVQIRASESASEFLLGLPT